VCWGKLADFAAEYLAKGRLVFVAGRMSYRAYEDRDGRKRRVAEVVATEVGPLDRPPERGPEPGVIPKAEGEPVPT
jgi:single-strand DNA-binding protein